MKDTIEHEVFDGSREHKREDFSAARGILLGVAIGFLGWLMAGGILGAIWRALAQ